MAKMRVGVIFGGRSGEHEISVLSANSIIGAIDPGKYQVYPIGITKEGSWLSGQSPAPLVESKNLQVRLMPTGGEPGLSMINLENTGGRILSTLRQSIDIVFPVMHGPYGEDGTIQGLLELAEIPYVGCGVLASAVGMDKALMKAVFEQKGLPVGDYLVYLRKEWTTGSDRVMDEIEKHLGYPCFVKPANLGSSVGISKARQRMELKQALDLAAEYDRKIVVEKMLRGREIECSILGNDEPMASLPGEIIPSADFYSYDAKYISNDSKLMIPAKLPPEIVSKVRDLAVRSFKAIDGAGLARVDFFVDLETAAIYVNEINTLPGFTRISMYPKLWEASGIGYSELIDRLLQLGLERHQDKMRNKIE